MKFRLSVKCDGAAFGDLPELELTEILRDAANAVWGRMEAKILDVNGNVIGEWRITE